ncbi:TonB-dependent receptor [Danxiaibacter flavus]|uniref:TonB-dependent receptor n=1 Tax=Danxiaibacter flavus TaxID=3049108 RepID=A0ABV3ZKW4_9BACT|nr:TonB-dependent receptor [Chitinophagaceae bacterium DXS]
MRITAIKTFFILAILNTALAREGKGQSVLDQKITVNFKGEKLPDALKILEKSADISFSYSGDVLDKEKKVWYSAENKELREVFTALFKPLKIDFEVVDSYIVLTKNQTKTSAERLSNLQLQAVYKEERTIKGIVTDETNKPLSGVSVTLKNKPGGVFTDEAGKFEISADNGDVLLFSSVGYISYSESIVAQRSNLTIALKSSSAELGEVVVVGYGTQKKTNVTGAISTVTMSKLTDVPVSNLSNALAGRAPGVNVTNTSGLAGATSAIRIRGSFGDPLYVIDGILRDKTAFDALDPNEIDQMSILKDAATASIYGSRAGNGVIMVTTKSGTIGKPVFNFQASYTTGKPTQELLSNKTTATDELIYQNRVAEFNSATLPNGQAEFDYFKNRNYNVNDWIWRNPQTQKYMLSVNGGSDKITYYSMLSYTNDKGSYINLDYGKYNLRTNVTAKISDDIKLNLNVSAAQQNPDRFYWPFTGDDDYNVGDFYRVTFNWPKLYPFYLNADGSPANEITRYPVQTPMGSWQAWNVIDQVEGQRYIKTRRRQLNTIATLDIKLHKLIPGLAAKVMANYEANDYMRKWFLTYQTNYVFISADPDGNRFIPGPPDPNKTNIFTFSQNSPFMQYNMQNGWNYQIDGYLTYNRNFRKHSVDGLLVYEQAETGLTSATAKAQQPIAPIDQMFAYSNDATNRYGTGYEQNGARQSWIGRFNYSFDKRYIAEFSFRYDGNTLFPPKKRWGFFPSASVGWRISQESFFKNSVSWVDELKLRASYGTTGNDLDVNNNKIAPFSYRYTYQNTGSYIWGNNLYTGIGPGATPNPNLTWATITNANIGLDFATLQNRLSGKVDVFVNKMTNILGARTVTLPDNYGQTLAPENYAARSFRGGEFSAEWRDMIPGSKINYSVYGNIGYAIDRWDVLDQSPDYQPGGAQAFRNAVGQPANRIFGYKAKGIIRTQDQLDELLHSDFKQFGRTPYLGALLFEDVRGDAYKPGADGKVDANDVQLLSKNGSPRINFGMGFNVSWKGFSFDAHFQGVSAYDRMISNLDGPGMRQWGGNFRTYYPIWAGDVWTPENPNGKYPRVVGQNWAEAGGDGSSFWIRNGGYLRLRNLNIAYNLPAKWLSRIKVLQTQFFINGTNLLTFSKMKEFQDPEQDNYDSYPIMKTFTIGANIRF